MIRTLAVATWAIAFSSQAQGASLEQLLEAAQANNVDRRLSAQTRTKAAADFAQAWSGLLPTLTATAAWTHNQYEAVVSVPTGPTTVNTITISPYDQFDATFRFDLPLIDVARWYRTAAASAGAEAAVAREGASLDQLKRQVVSTYLGYAASLSVLESARKSNGVASAQMNLQDLRAKAGAATELEVLRARAEVERTRQVIADAESLVATSRRSLRTLTGLDPGDSASLPPEDLSVEGAIDDLERRVDTLPSVRASRAEADAAARGRTGAALLLVPTVGAQFTERITNATGFAGRAAQYNAGLALVWRLDVATFQGWRSQNAVAASAELAAERSELQARDQVFGDFQRLTSARTKTVAAAAQVQAAQRAAQVARDRYAVGASTQVDVIQGERDLFAAEVGQIQAKAELASAHASLRISAGLPLDLK